MRASKTVNTILAAVCICCLSAAPQSLVEVARKEAERRQKLANVQARRIDGGNPSQVAPDAPVSTSSPAAGAAALPATPARKQSGESLRSFQSRLQKLDRDISQTEQKLKVLRLRLATERWAPTKTSKGSLGSGSSPALDQMRWQIQDLEARLADLSEERGNVFQAGKRAGYLPGELEGRVR